MKTRPTVYAIAQPNALGDVISCLPMASAIKRHDAMAKVVFIGRPYSRALIESSTWVDQYLDADEVQSDPALLLRHGVGVFLNPHLHIEMGRAARLAQVPVRIGNFVPKALSWANTYVLQHTSTSQRHRALLNLHYLRPLGIRSDYSLAELGGMLGLQLPAPLDPATRALLDPCRFNLVLHPKSNRSGREWPARYFERLVDLLPPDRVKIFVTGRPNEREQLLAEGALLGRDDVTDLTGRLDLVGLIALLQAADGLISSGTGPLHIAAALGTRALGLFPGRNRITAARWHPLGPQGESLSARTACNAGRGNCPDDYAGEDCPCMLMIRPEDVAARVNYWLDATAKTPKL